MLKELIERWTRLKRILLRPKKKRSKPSASAITEIPEKTIQTFDLVVGGERYRPKPIDTFSIGLDKDIALIQAFSTLPISLYADILGFASHYSLLGSAVFCEELEPKRYAVFVGNWFSDIAWVCEAMNRLEPGWKVYGLIAVSPLDSTINLHAILDAIVSIKTERFINNNLPNLSEGNTDDYILNN